MPGRRPKLPLSAVRNRVCKANATKAGNKAYNDARAALLERGDLDEREIESRAEQARVKAREERLVEDGASVVVKEEKGEEDANEKMDEKTQADQEVYDEEVHTRKRPRVESPLPRVSQGNPIPVHHPPVRSLVQRNTNNFVRSPPRAPAAYYRNPQPDYHNQNPHTNAFDAFGGFGGPGFLPQQGGSPQQEIQLQQRIQPHHQVPQNQLAQLDDPLNRNHFNSLYPGYDKLSPEEVQILKTLPFEHRLYIVQIANSTFNPMNLIKLEDHLMKDDEVNTSFDIFGKTTAKWSRSFLNYTCYLFSFYSNRYPTLFRALIQFHHQIVDLAEVCPWNSVLRLALSWQNGMPREEIPKPESWKIPEEVINRQLNAPVVLHTKGKVKGNGGKSGGNNKNVPTKAGGGGGGGGGGKSKTSKRHKAKVVEPCVRYNGSNGCNRTKCSERHFCEKCGGDGHGALKCKVKTE